MEQAEKKQKYRESCGPLNFPIFFQPWWLNIVCQKGSWDVCLATDKAGNITGALPYYLTSFLGFKAIRMPPFTPYLGVWLNYPKGPLRNVKKYSFENKVMGELIGQLPRVFWYHQIHPEQVGNWLPFFQKEFRQTTRYTYVFEEIKPVEIFENVKSEVRTRLRKAQGLYKIEEGMPAQDFFAFYNAAMKRQGLSMKPRAAMFFALHAELSRRGLGEIYAAYRHDGKMAAALYLIWDCETVYYWLPVLEKAQGYKGAAQMLIYYAIQEAAKRQLKFNFEGSMLPHIEPVFRVFGAERRPIHQIYKAPNRLFYALLELLKR